MPEPTGDDVPERDLFDALGIERPPEAKPKVSRQDTVEENDILLNKLINKINQPKTTDSGATPWGQALKLIDEEIAATPPNAWPTVQKMRQLTAQFSEGKYSHAGPYLKEMEGLGIEGITEMAGTEYYEPARIEGATRYNEFMNSTGLHHVQGQGLDKDKRSLHQAYIADSLLSRAPLYGPKRAEVHAAGVRAALDDRLVEIFGDPKDPNTLVTPDKLQQTFWTWLTQEAPVSANMRHAAAIHELKTLPDSALEMLSQFATYHSIDAKEARNPVEETVFTKFKLYHPINFSKTAQLLQHKRGYTPYTSQEYKAAGLKHHPGYYIQMLEDVMGSQWSTTIDRKVRDTRRNYMYHASGLAKPGEDPADKYSSDGVSVFNLAPGNAMRRLLAAHVVSEPESKQNLLAAVYINGPGAVSNLVASHVDKLNTMVQDDWSKLETEKTHELAALTPMQLEERGWLRPVMDRGLEALMTPFSIIRENAHKIDEELVKGSPWLQNTLKEYTRYATGYWDPDVSPAVKSIGEFISYVAKKRQLAPDAYGVFNSKKLFDDPVFGNADPKVLKAIFDQEYNMVENMQRYRVDTLKNWDKANEKVFGEDSSWWEKLYYGTHSAWYAFSETSSMMVGAMIDDPAEAAAFFLGGRAIGHAQKAIWNNAGIYKRGFNAARASQHLDDIAKHYPHLVRPIREKVGELMNRAIKDPKSEQATIDVLDDVNGVLKTLEQKWARTGQIDRSPFVQAVGRVWPQLSEDMGILGYTVGMDFAKYGVLEGALNWFNRNITKKGSARPNRMLSVVINDAEKAGHINSPLNEVINAQQRIYGSEASWTELSRNHKDFVTKNGRAPSGEELFQMLPKEVQPLHGYLMEAQNSSVDPGIWDRIAKAMGDTKYAKELKQFALKADEVLNGFIDDATNLAQSKAEWDVIRERQTTIVDVAYNKVQNLADRARLEARVLRDVEAPMATKASKADSLIKEAEKLELKADRYDADLVRIQGLRDHVQKYDFRAGPMELPGEILKDYITPQIKELLVTTDRSLWGGNVPEALFDFEYTPNKPAVVNGQLTKVSKLEKDLIAQGEKLERVRKNPTRHDRELRALREQHRKLKAEYEEYKKNPPKTADDVYADGQVVEKPRTAEEVYDAPLKDLADRISKREQVVKDTVGDEFYEEAGRFLVLKREHVIEHNRYLELKKGNKRVTLTKEGDEYFNNLLKWRGLPTSTAERLLDQKQSIRTLRQVQKLGISEGNPYTPAMWPLSHRGQALHQNLLAIKNQMIAAISRVDELSKIYDRMGPEARKILGEAQRTGTEPIQLYKNHPELKKYYDHMLDRRTPKPEGLEEWETVQEFFKQEGKLQLELLDLAEARLPKHVLDAWKEKIYDPPVYGAFERAHLLTEPLARKTMEAIRGKSSENISALQVRESGERFLFKRDPNKWRLRIEESDRVVDLLFDSRKELRQHLLNKYGKSTAELAKGKGTEGVVEGQTLYGEPMSIGRPIGNEEKLLGMIVGDETLPARRLWRFGEFARDIYIDGMLSAMNLYGDGILTAAQFAKIKATKNDALISKYVEVPKSERHFGAISGKVVRRDFLSELNRTMTTWDNMSSMLEGLRSAFSEYAGNIPAEIAEKIPGKIRKFVDGANEFARNNLIIRSIKAWTQQTIFNAMISDHLAGTKVFHPENWGLLVEAMREVAPGKAELIRSSDYIEANRFNIISGFFKKRHDLMRQLKINMLDLGDRAKVEALSARRQAIRRELDGVPDEALTRTLEIEDAAIRGALREHHKGFMRKLGRWTAGLVLDTKTNLGVSANKSSSLLRDWFSYQDEFFKFAQFKALRRKGMSPAAAAQVIKTFSQNYGEIPHWVRSITPWWSKSLVTSFPFEAGRILMNGLRLCPQRTLGVLSVIPALNLLNTARAGIPIERLEAILNARGAKNFMKAGEIFSTNLLFFDDQGDLESSIDFGTALPFADLTYGYGPIPQAVNAMIPEEDRGFWGTMMGAGAGVASNFWGNTPLYTTGSMLISHREPRTGRKMFSDKDSFITKGMGMMKELARLWLPPLLGGRDFFAVQDALDDRVSSTTGRKVTKEPGGQILKSILSVEVRGKAADKVGDLLGLKTPPRGSVVNDFDLLTTEIYRATRLLGKEPMDSPLLGETEERKIMAQRAMSEAKTPEERRQAEAAFEEVLRREREIRIGNLKGKVTQSERRIANQLAKLKKAGPLEFFGAQSIEIQGLVLARMDALRANPELMKDLITKAKWTDMGRIGVTPDPQLVHNALNYIRQRTKVSGHSPLLDEFEEHLLKRVLPHSEALYKREQKRSEVMPDIEERIFQRLRSRK